MTDGVSDLLLAFPFVAAGWFIFKYESRTTFWWLVLVAMLTIAAIVNQ